MNDNPDNWTDFLQNKQTILQIFSGGYPEFEVVQLRQLMISEFGHVHVSFNLPSLPKDCPTRWVLKKYDSLQLRFTFVELVKFSVCGLGLTPGLEVVARFDGNGVFQISHEKIQVEVSSALITLDVYPYDSTIFEEPWPWFR
jgi:hypothetical protein